MLEIGRYIRKPFEVDAVEVTAENMEEVASWCQGDVRTDDDGKNYIKVRVQRPLNESQTRAYVGDRVLYAGTGYKVYKPKAFKSSFDRVEGTNLQPTGNEKSAPSPKSMPQKSAAAPQS